MKMGDDGGRVINLSNNHGGGVLLVGNPNGLHIRYLTDLLRSYDIEPVFCENVYSAVGHLAGSGHKNGFIFGQFEQLNRHDGEFFRIAERYGFLCCCLTERVVPAEKDGVTIIKKVEEAGAVLAKFLDKSTSSGDFDKGKFRITKAEVDALFGGRVNE
jgi:hypothetical protein